MNTGDLDLQDTGRRRQRGFTVIELVACIVVLGILAAVAAPSLFDNQTFIARGYADEVASSLRYAQKIAIASGCAVQVTVDAAGYNARQQATLATCNGAGAWSTQVRRSDGTTLSGGTPANVNVNPATTVEFQPDGDPAGGAAAINVGPHIVTVDGNTGRVSMQ